MKGGKGGGGTTCDPMMVTMVVAPETWSEQGLLWLVSQYPGEFRTWCLAMRMGEWNMSLDEELSDAFQSHVANQTGPDGATTASAMTIDVKAMTVGDMQMKKRSYLLRSMPIDAIRSRIRIHQHLNRLLEHTHVLFDRASAGPGGKSSDGSDGDSRSSYQLLLDCRGMVFRELKMALWREVMNSYSGGGSADISVNRMRAAFQAGRKATPKNYSKIIRGSLFGQVCY